MNETDHKIDRLLRLKHIIGDRKANPPIEPIIPVSRSQWLQGVKKGIYPEPIKFGTKLVVWKLSDITHLINSLTR